MDSEPLSLKILNFWLPVARLISSAYADFTLQAIAFFEVEVPPYRAVTSSAARNDVTYF